MSENNIKEDDKFDKRVWKYIKKEFFGRRKTQY